MLPHSGHEGGTTADFGAAVDELKARVWAVGRVRTSSYITRNSAVSSAK